jgi:hypothetical protein
MKIVRILRPVFGIILLAALFSFAFSAEPVGRYIKGSVTASTGRPVASVWVTISLNGAERGRSLTGDDGKYYISNLAEGTYDIVVLQGNRQIYRGKVIIPGDITHNILIKR